MASQEEAKARVKKQSKRKMEKKGLRKRDKEGRRFCRPMEAETNEINTKQKRGKVTSKLKQGHHETNKCAWVSFYGH